MKGLYYYTQKVYQFSQSRAIFDKLDGKIITIPKFLITFLFFLLKHGPFRVKIMNNKLTKLPHKGRGIILGHMADNSLPAGKLYDRVFVYHGTSDKTFKMPDKKLDLNWFEFYFLTGPKDLYKLKTYSHNCKNLEKKIVKIGMFRSDPLFNNSYNREEVLKRYRIKEAGKKIILYAPTWYWGGGTLGKCFDIFTKELLDRYILIIRPHYNDRKNIRNIIEWQREQKKEHLYIFHKQHMDIMDFIYIADIMIGDNSAVNYDFALTRRPMVFVKTDNKDCYTPPEQFNVKLCGPLYDPEKDSIIEKIEHAFNNEVWRKRMERLVKESFYFNDGHAVDRACSFIVDRLAERGLIDREKALKKYGKYFTYRSDYK